MNWKQINTSREVRLWITTVIVPMTLGIATIAATNPELLRDSIDFTKRKIQEFKDTRKKETT